jgi:hypothetical protein
MTTRSRTARPTLPPEDEAKLAEASSDLAHAVDDSQRQTRRMERLAADIDSDRILSGGIVLEPLDDDDSLVTHIEEFLAAQGGR